MSTEEYETTDFEDNSSEEKKELLVNVRKRRKHVQSGKQELLAFNDSSDDDGCQTQDKSMVDIMNDSDTEGGLDEDNDVLDAMNWGDNRRTYYNTDFIDKDNSFVEKELELARAEEEEAKSIQLRLANHLTEADYDINIDKTVTIAKEDNTYSRELLSQTQSIHIATDLSGILQRERLQLIFKDSPELAGLTRDFNNFLDEVNALIWPVFEYVVEHKLPVIPALKFSDIYKNILMTFCSNVALYLLLKAKRVAIKNHPVIKRLVQLRQLLEELHDKYDNIIKPQLQALLQRIENGDKFEFKMPAATDKHAIKQRKLKIEKFDEYVPKNNKRIDELKQVSNLEDLSRDGDNENLLDAEEIGKTKILQENEKLRRGINYQIAKNKGLIAQRKKEQRNPRVKHRGKYRKALIRRKGAVRTLSSKVRSYDGEVSGIKATVSKSIKFKS